MSFHFVQSPLIMFLSLSRDRGIKPGKKKQLTEEDEAMLSASEDDYDAFDSPSERASKRLFSPNFRFHRWHATFMLIALLVFVFYMPFRVAFHPRER